MHVLNLVHLWIDMWILWSISHLNRLALNEMGISVWKTVDNPLVLWTKSIIFIRYTKNV